jgi:hypothetical protein
MFHCFKLIMFRFECDIFKEIDMSISVSYSVPLTALDNNQPQLYRFISS